MTSASPSQSSRISTTASVFPDVSPLCQSSCRERLQNHASPVSRVRRSASSFIQPSMSTRPSRASCTIAAWSSGCIAKVDAEGTQLRAQLDEPRGCSCRIDASSAACDDAERIGDVLRVARHRRRRSPAATTASRSTRELLEVVAVLRAVAVDRRDEQLAGAALLALARPLDGVARRVARRGVGADAAALGVDRDDDGLAAERRARAPRSARGRASAAELTLILSAPASSSAVASCERADAAAERERDRHLLGDARRDVDGRDLRVDRRRDVEEDELVGAPVGVRGAELDRVADVAQPLELARP